MQEPRKIRISIDKIIQARKDGKESLEALSFSTLVLLTFLNPCLFKNARNAKSNLHMGTDRIKRCINNGMKFGLIEDIGDRYLVKSLREEKERSVKVSLEEIGKRHTTRDNKIIKSSRVSETTIDDIISFFLGINVENHVKQKEYVSECYELSETGNNRRLVRLLKKCSFQGTHDNYKGSSLETISNKLGVSYYKTRMVLSYETKTKRLKRHFEETPLYEKFRGLGVYPPKRRFGESDSEFRQRYRQFLIQVNFILRSAGYTGFATSINGQLVYRSAYVYQTTKRSI